MPPRNRIVIETEDAIHMAGVHECPFMYRVRFHGDCCDHPDAPEHEDENEEGLCTFLEGDCPLLKGSQIIRQATDEDFDDEEEQPVVAEESVYASMSNTPTGEPVTWSIKPK